VTVPWNDDDVRREMKNREGALADGMTTMAARGEGIRTMVGLVSQREAPLEPDIQLWRRCDLPPDVLEDVELSAPHLRDSDLWLPVMVRALDGEVWIMWMAATPLARGGTG
jgi:hypothetical protein